MKKILFIYYYYDDKIKSKGRVEFPPLGMLYICAIYQKMGFEVEVFYFNQKTQVEEFPPADIYAYSISSTVCYEYYREVIPKLKRNAKLHIAGNTHANIFPENVLKELDVDVVFVGESEVTVEEWIKGGMKQRGIIRSVRAENIDYPFPARNLIPDSYIYMQNRVGGKSHHSISMISSRGCVFNCQFCAIQNRGKVSFRSLEDFERELKYILRRYPLCDGITLLDETFTMRESHAIGIINIFKKYNIPFECNSRFDTLNTNIIKALANSPCKEVRIGAESGSQTLLDAMNKGTVVEKTKKVLEELYENGLGVKLYIMHGFPGENMETTRETISYLEEISQYITRISLYRFTPLPGSPVYQSSHIIKHDFKNYTIYENAEHWWGTIDDYNIMNEAYELLARVVEKINCRGRDDEC